MERRQLILGVTTVCAISLAGCTASDADEPTPTEEREFEGWIDQEELEEGYTVVYISQDWEVVPAEDTQDWDPNELERYHRGMCKRYFVFESIPEDYEAFMQGRCEEGVTVTVHDGAGTAIAEMTLPPKEIEA